MANRTRLLTTLIAPVAAFAAVGAMTIVSPVNATPATSSSGPAATAASATTANAAAGTRWRMAHRDRIRDVRSTSGDTQELRRVRTNKTADIVKVKATHSRKLVITTTTRRTMPKDQMGVIARLATTAGDFNYQVDFIRNFIGQGNVLQLSTDEYQPVPCAGLKAERRNSKNLIRIIIPAKCISKPRRVKVGVVTLMQKRDRLFIDDAFSRTTNGQDIGMSRWIPRR